MVNGASPQVGKETRPKVGMLEPSKEVVGAGGSEPREQFASVIAIAGKDAKIVSRSALRKIRSVCDRLVTSEV
jgi:hypothetical protein